MSKKFHAVNRKTGEKWKPSSTSHHQYLVMYDSGYLAVVNDAPYECWVTTLDVKEWKKVMK